MIIEWGCDFIDISVKVVFKCVNVVNLNGIWIVVEIMISVSDIGKLLIKDGYLY